MTPASRSLQRRYFQRKWTRIDVYNLQKSLLAHSTDFPVGRRMCQDFRTSRGGYYRKRHPERGASHSSRDRNRAPADNQTRSRCADGFGGLARLLGDPVWWTGWPPQHERAPARACRCISPPRRITLHAHQRGACLLVFVWPSTGGPPPTSEPLRLSAAAFTLIQHGSIGLQQVRPVTPAGARIWYRLLAEEVSDHLPWACECWWQLLTLTFPDCIVSSHVCLLSFAYASPHTGDNMSCEGASDLSPFKTPGSAASSRGAAGVDNIDGCQRSGLDLLAFVSTADAEFATIAHEDAGGNDSAAHESPLGIGDARASPSDAWAASCIQPPARSSEPHTHSSGIAVSTSGSVGHRSNVPLPFVRKLRLHLDSCAGTNKSQYFYGGLGLLLSCGLLDCAMVLYMVVGHTKFGPDRVAQALAGRFKRSDAFNNGKLVQMFKSYATSGAYDGSMLHTCRDGSKTIFSAITHIMSYRCFVLLADDGQVNLGDPVIHTPPGFEPFVDPGPHVSDIVLMAECKKSAARGLRHDVFPSLHKGTFVRVGQEALPSRSGAPPDAMLLPERVSTSRLVRLFMRLSADDLLWREQVGWMVTHEVPRINDALAAIQPYSEHPELRKIPYGAKALADLYAKYVPRRFVPDRFEVPTSGASGMASSVWKQMALEVDETKPSTKPGTSTVAPAAEDQHGPSQERGKGTGGKGSDVPPAVAKARWKRTVHT